MTFAVTRSPTAYENARRELRRTSQEPVRSRRVQLTDSCTSPARMRDLLQRLTQAQSHRRFSLCIHNRLCNAAEQILSQHCKNRGYQQAISQNGLESRVCSGSLWRCAGDSYAYECTQEPIDCDPCNDQARCQGDTQEQPRALDLDRPEIAIGDRHGEDKHEDEDRSCENEKHGRSSAGGRTRLTSAAGGHCLFVPAAYGHRALNRTLTASATRQSWHCLHRDVSQRSRHSARTPRQRQPLPRS
jgi:hypothetical protein